MSEYAAAIALHTRFVSLRSTFEQQFKPLDKFGQSIGTPSEVMKALSFTALALGAMPLAVLAAPADDPPDPAEGLLSIVSFSVGEECSENTIVVSTGNWGEGIDHHCSPIAESNIVSAKVVFLDTGCEGESSYPGFFRLVHRMCLVVGTRTLRVSMLTDL